MTEQGKGGVDSKISEIRHLIGNLASSQYENGQSGGKQTEHSCEVRTKLEATIIAALSAAQGECEALKAEVEETRQAAYRIQDEYNNAQAPLQLNHAAEVFIDRFVNDPPENYWSHNIVRDGEQFEIVVQRRNGLTPAQKNEKAEQRIAELEREVEQQRADFEQRKAAFIQQQNELIVELAEERGGGVHCNDCGSYDIRPDAPTQQEATND
jgi:hypothetical protein